MHRGVLADGEGGQVPELFGQVACRRQVVVGPGPVTAAGADEDGRTVQEALDPHLLGVLGQRERVFGRRERRVPGAEAEVHLGQGAHRQQPLRRDLGVARVADEGEVATGAGEVVGRDPQRATGGELVAVAADQHRVRRDRLEHRQRLFDPAHHAQAEGLRRVRRVGEVRR